LRWEYYGHARIILISIQVLYVQICIYVRHGSIYTYVIYSIDNTRREAQKTVGCIPVGGMEGRRRSMYMYIYVYIYVYIYICVYEQISACPSCV
jgi:hypothetical protein